MLNNYICALDIGSSKIAAVVAVLKKGCLAQAFFESVPAKGVKCGMAVDSIALVGLISRLMKGLKAKSGIGIKSVYVNISGQDIIAKHSHAIIPLAERGNKVITRQDIERVNEQARILGSSLEEEIVHALPFSYTIDSKSNITNPLGLYSHRLEVDLYLICAKLSQVQSLSRVINQSGYEIKKIFFSGLATSRAVFNQRPASEGLDLFCDIGSDITELLVFKSGILHDIEVLPVGGDSLTNGLQDALKIPFDLAEDIKISHGVIAGTEEIGEDKEILVKKSNFYKPLKRRAVLEILTAAAKSISSQIRNAVEKKASLYEVDSFIVTGRTALLEGFIETLENSLSMPVKLGRLSAPQLVSLVKEDAALSGQRYLTYLTALGMICEVLQKEEPARALFSRQPGKGLFNRALNRVKEVYQEYF